MDISRTMIDSELSDSCKELRSVRMFTELLELGASVASVGTVLTSFWKRYLVRACALYLTQRRIFVYSLRSILYWLI